MTHLQPIDKRNIKALTPWESIPGRGVASVTRRQRRYTPDYTRGFFKGVKMAKKIIDRKQKTEKNKGVSIIYNNTDSMQLEPIDPGEFEPVDPGEFEPLDCMLWEFPEG